MDDRDALLARIARLEALVAQQAETIAVQAARIKELEAELRRVHLRIRHSSLG